MQKTILNKHVSLLLSIFISLTLFTSITAYGQIILTDEPVPFKPKEFYIAGITDERTDKSAAALILEPEGKTVVRTVTLQPSDLQGGAYAAISRFIEHNLSKDKFLRPVVISIKEFKLTESAAAGGNADGRIKLHLSFGLQKNYGTEHLVDYNGGSHYIRDGANIAAIERSIRGVLNTGLVYFNDWMNMNAGTNRKLAKNVQISFTDYMEKPEGDSIYYSANRPLTWADFQSHTKPSGIYEALVMPGFGYEQRAEVAKSVIHVNITMKTYLPKSAGWVNYSGRNDYNLNHEQRHFDIVKIISEQFKQKILAAGLTPDTYEAFINIQYLDSYRDLDAMQSAYDKETGHGVNRSAQTMWNDRIDRELKIKSP
ncbi:MAG TPA: hypothetical protein VGC08_10130 [Pedobacter sp.]